MKRFTKRNPCPICGGYDNQGRGRGKRCYGFLDDDNLWAHCTREEFAGGLEINPASNTYAHRLEGDCKCGQRHDGMPRYHSTKSISMILATYDYRDVPDNRIVHRVVRYFPKAFSQCRPDGHGGWIPNMKGVTPILYRRPELLKADPTATVFIPEGEKDVENLIRLGLVATTNVGGAGKFRPEYVDDLRGRSIVLLPHNDKPGRDHSIAVATMASGVAQSVRIVNVPVTKEGGDVSDWLEQGGTKQQLLAMVEAAPEFCATEPIVPQEGHGVSAERNLFQTPDQLFSDDGEVRKWLAYPLIAEASITEITGLVKSAGKTTFTMALVRAVLSGDPFMEQPTIKTPVLYMTEQTKSSLEDSLVRAGLIGQPDLRLVLHSQVIGMKWVDTVRLAIAQCKQIGAKLMVVDTVAQFAGLRGDDENKTGPALAAMEPLQQATHEGIAVIVIRHDRKSQGEPGQSGRGSSAWSGVMDTIIAIRRPEGNHKDTIRKLVCVSRLDGPPQELLIELTPNGYVSLGDNDAVVSVQAREAVLKFLPETAADAVSLKHLRSKVECSRTTLQTSISLLLSVGLIEKIGAGVKGDPIRYYRIHSAETQSPVRRQNELEPPEPTAVPKRPVMAAVSSPCSWCGSAEYWQRPDGSQVCSSCHPNPAVTQSA